MDDRYTGMCSPNVMAFRRAADTGDYAAGVLWRAWSAADDGRGVWWFFEPSLLGELEYMRGLSWGALVRWLDSGVHVSGRLSSALGAMEKAALLVMCERVAAAALGVALPYEGVCDEN